jgi:hypothetical protein
MDDPRYTPTFKADRYTGQTFWEKDGEDVAIDFEYYKEYNMMDGRFIITELYLNGLTQEEAQEALNCAFGKCDFDETNYIL